MPEILSLELLIQALKLSLISALLQLLRFIPMPLLQVAGKGVGRLMYLFPTQSRHVTRRNLELCFTSLGREEIDSLTLASLQETARMAFELGRVWTAPPENTMQLIRSIRGEELVRQALAIGRGLIVLGPHLGNWELFGLKLSGFAPTTYLYKPPKVHELESLITRYRARAGAMLAPTNRHGVMQLRKALERGEIVGILPDQEPELSGGVFAPFFGRDALTMTLASRLAAKTGATVLAGFARRLPAGGFEVVFLPADAETADSDPLRAATALNRTVEACVREAPAQYQWEYKRFRKRPQHDSDRLY